MNDAARIALDGAKWILDLEIGFVPPPRYIGPRIRKLSRDGRNSIIADVGHATGRTGSSVAPVSPSSNGDRNWTGLALLIIGINMVSASFFPIVAIRIRRRQRYGPEC